MNWGYKIMIVFSLFVAGIVVLVIKSSRQSQQMVTTGYYEKELVFQQQIDARNRSASLSKGIAAGYFNEVISIAFPPEMKGREISASIHLYCAADEQQDRMFVEQTTDAVVTLNAKGVKAGKYYLKLSWQQGQAQYYDEVELLVP